MVPLVSCQLKPIRCQLKSIKHFYYIGKEFSYKVCILHRRLSLSFYTVYQNLKATKEKEVVSYMICRQHLLLILISHFRYYTTIFQCTTLKVMLWFLRKCTAIYGKSKRQTTKPLQVEAKTTNKAIRHLYHRATQLKE